MPAHDLATGQPIQPTAEEAQATAGPTDPNEVPVMSTESAFLVFLDGNGHWQADSTKVNQPVQVGREANLNDFNHAVADIRRDLDANAAAETLMIRMQMAAVQAQQQQQAQQILRGIKIPGQPA